MTIRDLWDLGTPWEPAAARNWGEAISDAVDTQGSVATWHAFRSGWWYESLANDYRESSFTVGRLICIPFIVGTDTTFDRIQIEVTSAAAAGGTASLGIYADGGDGFPDSLILDAGSVDTDSTGEKAIVINENLAPGMVWLACVPLNESPSLSALRDPIHRIFPSVSDSFNSNRFFGVREAGISTLPSVFSGTAIETTVPRIRLRAA